MLRILFAIVLLAALPGHQSFAQVSGNSFTEVRPGELIEIVSSAPADSAIVWDVIEPANLDYRTYESDHIFVCSSGAKPGRIVLSQLVISIVDGKPKVQKTRYTIQVGEPIELGTLFRIIRGIFSRFSDPARGG